MGKELSVSVGIWKLVEFLLNDTKTFSLSSIDGVFTYRSKDIAYSTRKSEIEIATKQMMPLMIHLIMYCYPDEYLGSKERLKSNEDEIMKKWLRKISKEMLVFKKSRPLKKGSFIPVGLELGFTPANAKTMRDNLEKYPGYTNPVLTNLVVNDIQRIFLNEWNMVINKNIDKGATSVSDSELIEVLKSTKRKVLSSVWLKDFKINRANVFKRKSN